MTEDWPLVTAMAVLLLYKVTMVISLLAAEFRKDLESARREEDKPWV